MFSRGPGEGRGEERPERVHWVIFSLLLNVNILRLMLRIGSSGASISGFTRDGRDSPYLSNMAQAMFGFYLWI